MKDQSTVIILDLIRIRFFSVWLNPGLFFFSRLRVKSGYDQSVPGSATLGPYCVDLEGPGGGGTSGLQGLPGHRHSGGVPHILS